MKRIEYDLQLIAKYMTEVQHIDQGLLCNSVGTHEDVELLTLNSAAAHNEITGGQTTDQQSGPIGR